MPHKHLEGRSLGGDLLRARRCCSTYRVSVSAHAHSDFMARVHYYPIFRGENQGTERMGNGLFL